jgi:hypothetical protein
VNNRRSALSALCFGVALIGYGVSVGQLDRPISSDAAPELVVTLPLAAQVLFAGGDRHLAANLSGFRVLVASTARMSAADYKVQARLQQDIVWLNPAHEDNYYIAAAILPWAGEVAASQDVLQRATDVRRHDWMPGFYFGFGRYYFYKDPAGGSEALLKAAAAAANEQDALSLRVLALKWAEKGYSIGQAAGVVDAMAKTAPPGSFKKYIEKRAERLKGLAQLRDAAQLYRQRYQRPLRDLDELVRTGVLPQLPVDPVGYGYAIDPDGTPIFKGAS